MDTSFFKFSQIFFKVEAVILCSNSVFFNILFPASANGFSAYGNSILQTVFRAILWLLGIISLIQGDSFFRLLERSISMKSFIPTSRNEIFVCWKQYCFILSFFGEVSLKTKYIPASEHQFFRHFKRF